MTPFELPARVGLLLEAHASIPLNERVAEVCRVAVAEELRTQAAIYAGRAAGAQRWMERPSASEVVSASASTSYRELTGIAIELRRRADALDPEGATR
jgi:hypothetical protein